MRDQTERMRGIEDLMKHEFKSALSVDLITEEECEKYLAELKALTDFIYEQQKDRLLFTKEGWNKINDYYEYVLTLDFVRDRIKEGLEYLWLIVR